MFGRHGRADTADALKSGARQIVVVDETDDFVVRIAHIFEDCDVKRVGHVDDAIKTARQPTVVLVAPAAVNEDTLDRIETLRELDQVTAVAVVLVVARMSTGVLRRAMRAGVNDVLAASCTDGELADVLANALTRVQYVDQVALLDKKGRGRVVAVFSPKGGVGTTTVSVNMAAAVATTPPAIVVDADLPFGDVAITLGLDPGNSLADATGADLDVARLRGLLAADPATGVLALVAPADPARAESVMPADVVRALELCSEMSPLVFVDTSSAFDDLTLSILDHADDVIVVATPDVATIKNVKVGLDTLKRLGVAQSHIYLVLNRVGTRSLLPTSEIEKALGQKATVIPEDDAVAQATHAGRPVVVDAPRSKAGRAYTRLAVQFQALDAITR